jgi:hypothetical protein
VIQAGLTIETVKPQGTLVTCTLIKERSHAPRSRDQQAGGQSADC